MTKLPRQIALVRALFPAGIGFGDLVNLINQFALEVVQAFRFVTPTYKTLTFTTGDDPTTLFPIDFPVEATPNDVWIANSGDSGLSAQAMTVKWEPIVGNKSSLQVRVNLLTGLANNSTYSVRLGYR